MLLCLNVESVKGRMKSVQKSKRRGTSDYQGLQQRSGRKAPRSKSLRSRSICGSGGFYAVVGEDAEDSRLEREFSEVRQMKGQRIALSAQLDSIQNPKRLGVFFATKLHTDIIFIVMMILKTSNAVNVSQEEEERKKWE